jgi:hypothetical protein
VNKPTSNFGAPPPTVTVAAAALASGSRRCWSNGERPDLACTWRVRRTDISRDIKLTGTFLADLVGKIAQVEKDLSKSNPKASDAYAKAVAIKLYGGDQRQALHSIRNALLSSIFFVQLHFDFEIRTDSGSDALGTAMQRWGKRLPRKAEDHASAVRARDQKQAVKALEKSAPAGPTKSEKTTKKVQQVKAKQSEMAASAEFALEVYNYVEEKGEQLGEHKLFSAVTDQLESVVHIESKRGMNEPFDVPAQVKEVCPAPHSTKQLVRLILHCTAVQKTIGPAWTWLYLRHRFATHVSPALPGQFRALEVSLTGTSNGSFRDHSRSL